MLKKRFFFLDIHIHIYEECVKKKYYTDTKEMDWGKLVNGLIDTPLTVRNISYSLGICAMGYSLTYIVLWIYDFTHRWDVLKEDDDRE